MHEPVRGTAREGAGAGPDLLSELLRGLRLDGVEYGRCVLQPPWAVAFPAQRSARFHFVSHGGAWLRTRDADWLALHPGDAVLLPRGGFHVIASAPDAPVVDIATLERVALADGIYQVQGRGPGGRVGGAGATTGANGANGAGSAAGAPPAVMFCGAMRFNLDPLHPLVAMMPDVMRAGELARRDPTVPALLEAMEREVAHERIGSEGLLARLADVLAASILRAWLECACSSATGWIAALRCPKVGKVLSAIHAEPERHWDVAALAQLMGASRSSFTEAFTRTVGETPARYVAKIKMFEAQRWIAEHGLRISVAAERLGYDSEASFSRAFKRVMGHPPSAARAPRGTAQRHGGGRDARAVSRQARAMAT